MKFYYSLLILLASCSNAEVAKKTNEDASVFIDSLQSKKDTMKKYKEITRTSPVTLIKDTVTMDDFPVTDSIFRCNMKNIQIDSLISYSHWYYNNETNQVLIFDLETDFHRYQTFLFSTELVNERSMTFLFQKKPYVKNSQVSEKDAALYFPKFIEQSTPLNQSYFTSKKGLNIGMNIKEVISKFDKPDTIIQFNKLKLYRWEYRGDLMEIDYEGEMIRNKKVARNSFGYQVSIYVKNEKIIGLNLLKDMP